MPITFSIFPRLLRAYVIAAGRNLAVLVACLVACPEGYSSSGSILPVGYLEIRESGGVFEMILHDDSDEAVSDVALNLTDDSIAGALLFVHGLPRSHGLTLEPSGRPAGHAALYRGDSLLVLQPPRIGDTDSWILQIHAPTAHAGVTAIVGGLIVEVEHAEINGACEAPGTSQDAGGLSFDSSVIVIRIKPVPDIHPAESWPY